MADLFGEPSPALPDEQAAFLAAIRHDPDDDTPRLVYADWLQERGNEDRAKLIRLSIEKFRLADPNADPSLDRWNELSSRVAELWRSIERDEFPEVMLDARRGFFRRAICLWRDWVRQYPSLIRSRDVVLESLRLRSSPRVEYHWITQANGVRFLRARWSIKPDFVRVPDDGTSSTMRAVGLAFLQLFRRDFPGHCPNVSIRVEWTDDREWLGRCVRRAIDGVMDRADGHRHSRPRQPTPLFGRAAADIEAEG